MAEELAVATREGEYVIPGVQTPAYASTVIDVEHLSAAELRLLWADLQVQADTQQEKGDLDGATALYERALQARHRLLKAEGETPTGLRELSTTLNKLADARLEAGDLDEATAAHRQSLAVDTRLAKVANRGEDDIRSETETQAPPTRLPELAAAAQSIPSSSSAALPRHYLRPAILIVLAEGPSDGYRILESVRRLGIRGAEPGGLYRYLRAMEKEELLASSWEVTPAGPARRTYVITGQGKAALEASVDSLRDVRRMIVQLLEQYESPRE